MSSDLAIQVSNVSKHYQIYNRPLDRLKQALNRGRKQFYKDFSALNNISFEVKKGETVGIIGRNGSGKSTLLQMICGTLTPTSGDIKIKGRVAALLELGAGFNPEFTGRENVYMNASILGLNKQEIDEKYDDITKFADIGEYIDQPVKTYSSGMYVRLAFSVIAHADAEILIIDEALSVGDAFFVQKCMRFLREFMKQGTILFVSHDTGAVASLCDRAIWLEGGAIAAQGSPKDTIESYLEKLYESKQGDSVIQSRKNVDYSDDSVKPVRDMRLEFINQTTLRNDIEFFPFSSDTQSFGKGGAIITGAQLLDENENTLSWVIGGEQVKLSIKAEATKQLHNVIVGFQVKDRLGQIIFADNTYIAYIKTPLSLSENECVRADFVFTMPVMPLGDYSMSVALAEGTQEDHVQHQWIHDAIMFKVHSTSVCLGLIGVPMKKIYLNKF